MRRIRSLLCASLCLSVSLGAARGDDVAVEATTEVVAETREARESPPEPPAELKIIQLRTLPASEMAMLLRDMLPVLQAAVEPQGNSLVISGPREAVKSAEALTSALDDASAASLVINLEFVLVEQQLAAGESPELDPQGVLEGRESPQEKHRTAFRLRAINNQQASLQVGGTTSVVTSETVSGRGFGPTRAVRQEQAGTILTAVARHESEESIVVEFTFEMSRVEPSAPDQIGGEKSITSMRSSVRLKPGAAAVLGTYESGGPEAKTRMTLVGRASADQD